MNASPLSALRFFVFVALPFTGILGFAACNSPDDIVIGTDHQKVACSADADCPSNEPCLAGFCGGTSSTASGSGGASPTTGTGGGMSTVGAGGCPSMPSAEVCDGIDNDCNGVVDDNAACPAGSACVSGACVTGGATDGGAACPGMMLPTAEVCDGIDNDCNGIVDDNASCGAGTCVNGACTGPLPCAKDSDCPMGHVCVNGACSP